MRHIYMGGEMYYWDKGGEIHMPWGGVTYAKIGL